MSRRSPVQRGREEGFYDGVILALQVITGAGDMGCATYEELLKSAGAVETYRRAESEGMLEMSGLKDYVRTELHARSEELRAALAAQQPAAEPFVGVVCPECNAEYVASAKQPAAECPDCLNDGCFCPSCNPEQPAAVDGDVAWIRLCGSQGEPAGTMTVTAELRDGSEVVLIRDTGNEIDHAVNLAAALAGQQGGEK